MDDTPAQTPPEPAPEHAPDTPPPGGPGAFPPKPLPERAKDILLKPRDEWMRIDGEPATVGGIYTGYVMILAAIPPLATAIGQLAFGYSFLGYTYRPPAGAVIGQAITTYVLSLVSVFVLALIIDALAPNFGGKKDQLKALKVSAYSMTAAWLAGIFAIVPGLAFLGLLGLYSFYLLYLGLPRLMRAPEEKAVLYTVVAIVAAIVLWIVVGAIATVFAPTPTLGTLTGPGLR